MCWHSNAYFSLFSSLFFFDFHRTNFSGFRRTFHQFRSGWLCYFCYSSRRVFTGGRVSSASASTRTRSRQTSARAASGSVTAEQRDELASPHGHSLVRGSNPTTLSKRRVVHHSILAPPSSATGH